MSNNESAKSKIDELTEKLGGVENLKVNPSDYVRNHTQETIERLHEESVNNMRSQIDNLKKDE